MNFGLWLGTQPQQFAISTHFNTTQSSNDIVNEYISNHIQNEGIFKYGSGRETNVYTGYTLQMQNCMDTHHTTNTKTNLQQRYSKHYYYKKIFTF